MVGTGAGAGDDDMRGHNRPATPPSGDAPYPGEASAADTVTGADGSDEGEP